MRKPSHSNPSRRKGSNSSRKPQNRNQGSGGNPNRRKTNPNRNRQATEMWMQPTSQTLTSHIPMVNRSQGRDNASRKGDQRPGANGGRQKSWQSQKGQRNGKTPDRPAPTAGNGGRGASLAGTGPDNVARPKGLSKLVADIEPFELFCAYHLGITIDRRYKPANINEVANRFRVDPATIKQALKEYDMDPVSLMDRDFDMALSQLDIQVAPEGVDRRELAKTIYEEFLEAPRIKRDWNRILEEDRKENQKVFKD